MIERHYESPVDVEQFSANTIENPLIDLPYGNALIYGIRHGEVDKHGHPRGSLTEIGSQQIRYTTRTIIGEISRFSGTPIDLYYFHTDRVRTEASLEDLYFEFEKQIALDKATDGPLRNANVRKIERHPLLDNANDIGPVFKMVSDEAAHIRSAVLPAWLNSDPEVLHSMGAVPAEETLKNSLQFISKFNEMAKQDPHTLKVGIAITHEHAIAALINQYFPDLHIQPAYAEAFAVNTGNDRQEAELTFRNQRSTLYLPEYYIQTSFIEQLDTI